MLDDDTNDEEDSHKVSVLLVSATHFRTWIR